MPDLGELIKAYKLCRVNQMSLRRATPLVLFLLIFVLFMATGEAETIEVGDSQGWRFGFNYTDWAIQNSPFYIGDTLVFKYPAPAKKNSLGENVYLLPDLWSYITCDFTRAKLLAGPKEGSGEGFKIVLDQWRPYYFASGERNGYHCSAEKMKFFAVPWPRWQF